MKVTVTTRAFGDGYSQPILETHCNYCHGLPDEYPEGDLSLAGFDSREAALHSPRTWKKVLNAIEGYEMPPSGEEPLTAEDQTKLIAWIQGLVAEPEFGDARNPGRPVLRRLTRLEYNNTVRDLLGLETDVFMFSERLPFEKSYFDSAADKMPERLQIRSREYGARYPVLLPDAGLPSDSRAEHGFTNRGDAQNFSAAQLEQYVELAEQIAFHPELLSRAERMQTAGASVFSLEEFRQRLQTAFEEDRGGVYNFAENANSTIAGKGGVLRLAFGKHASRVLGVNPSEDIWNAAFATAEERSGDALLTHTG